MGMYGERSSRMEFDPALGRTRQDAKDECDVNLIVANHRRGGVSSHVVARVAEYGFVPATTFMACMLEVRKAEEVFAQLPAATRDFFSNDPARFVDYASKPDNLAKLVELGLAVKPAEVSPALGSRENPMVTVAAPPPPAPAGSGPGGTPG